MRFLPAVLACVAWSGATTGTAQVPQQRDGAWLQNGIKLHQRMNAHDNLSEKDASEALVATSYVCAVVDLEKYLVQRAELLAGALEDGKKKRPLDPKIFDGMTRALPILVPLMKTDFFADSPSCESVLIIVRDYLEEYPEMLPKGAEAIVEKALLEAYTKDSGSLGAIQ
jgi:hypothetical protein